MKTIRLIAAVFLAAFVALSSVNARYLTLAEESALATDFELNAFGYIQAELRSDSAVQRAYWSGEADAFQDCANTVAYSCDTAVLASIYRSARDYCLAHAAAESSPLLVANWQGMAAGYDQAAGMAQNR